MTADLTSTSGPSGAADGLHVVIGEAPAAVLLVNLARGEVVHANEVAQQLAPEVRLPVRLDAWSEAAGLRDPEGEELAETQHPLSKVLRSEAVPGQPVSAQRHSEMGGSREPLWVVGVPMTGAPMLEEHALVVFLAVREQEATAAVEALAQREAVLRERAVMATGLSFTVADARHPDMPLVWVNQAFTNATGYAFEEAVGRNCRFLQGPGTDQEEIGRLRQALAERTSFVSTLLNYRRDGLAFWNQITITPILDAEGVVTHFVGVQSDVSGRVEADRERDRALQAARDARQEAEDAHARLALLAEVTEALSGELEEAEARERLLELVVPQLCDVAFFLHLDAGGAVVAHHARHRDPAMADVAERYGAEVAELVPASGLVDSLLGDQTCLLLSDVDAPGSREAQAGFVTDQGFAERAGEALDVRSTIIVGLPGRDHVRDVLVLDRVSTSPRFTSREADLVLDLGRRCGLIFENLRLYANTSRISRALQRSLLPSIPELPWVDIDARYLPGAADADVGGDFFDLFQHDDESIGVAVGDVEGHDIHAAAAMGQLKGLLRATALTQRLMPAATLEQVDQLLDERVDVTGRARRPDADAATSPRLASTVFVHLEPPVALGAPEFSTDELERAQVGTWPSRRLHASAEGVEVSDTRAVWTLTLSSAGHLPPLVRLPDGQLTFLDAPHARGPLLGLGSKGRRRHDGTFALPAGSVVLLYTDGLVERSGESLDAGLDRLLETAADAPEDLSEFVDHLLAELGPASRPAAAGGHDDTVVVAMCLRARVV